MVSYTSEPKPVFIPVYGIIHFEPKTGLASCGVVFQHNYPRDFLVILNLMKV